MDSGACPSAASRSRLSSSRRTRPTSVSILADRAGGRQGAHKLTGVGPGFITENFERAREHLDEMILVPDEEAYAYTRLIARHEGILVGPTSGASAWVAGQLAARPEYAGQTIVCFFYDSGERYLSTPGLFPADNVEKVT